MGGWRAQRWLAPSLVGVKRTEQFHALVALAQHAWDGQGQVVLLAGETGTGKTRLIRETRQLAGRRRVRIVEGACFEPDRGVPFAPLLDMLRTPAVPVWLEQPDGADPDEHKRRVFASLLALLQDMAGGGPLLVVLEDVHWADDASLEFLRLLARRAVDLPALVLISYRMDEASPSLIAALADLQRQRLATELMLGPLSRGDTEVMLQTILEDRRALGPGVVDRIFDLTDGNPFFVEELLGSLLVADETVTSLASFDSLAMPRTIRAAVQRRVEAIHADAREVLVLASVLGRRFDFSLLEELTGRPEDELLSLTRELIAAGLVVEESAERFAFRHALTRQSVYAELLARERCALHRRALESIERLSRDAAQSAQIEDLAYHAYAASDWPTALECCQLAGERALTMHAPGAAVEHFSHALDASQQLGLSPNPNALRGRGQAYETLGAFDPARIDLEAMVRIAQSLGDGRSEWQALLDLGLLWAARDYARARGYLDDALALARTFEDPAPLAHTLNRLGNWYMNAEAPREAASYHHQALSVFEPLDDPRGLASTLDLLGLAETLTGKRESAAAHYRRAIELFRRGGDRRGLVSALSMLSWLGQGDPSETIVAPAALALESAAFAREAVDVARAINWRAGEAYALAQGALLPIARGEYDLAFNMTFTALRIADEIEHRQWALMAHLDASRMFADLLAWRTATLHLERARDLAEAAGSEYFRRLVLAAMASTRIARGRVAEAQVLLDGVSDLDSLVDPVHRWLWRVRAELDLAARRPAVALDALDRLIASAEAAGSAPGAPLPALAFLRGRALLDLGQLDEGIATLTAGCVSAEQRNLAPLVWRGRLAEGLAWRRLARRLRAEQAFAAARATIEHMAAGVPAAVRAEAEDVPVHDHFLKTALAQVPSSPRLTPARAAKRAAGGLTGREREVARLVARGKSNGGIAADLFLGRRTVETHVANICLKLGVNSRAQVAAWAADNLRNPSDKTP
jgi:DNA-binding CsgD family transcriptional regulator/tetratricopeptide (TPR) repeat protein